MRVLAVQSACPQHDLVRHAPAAREVSSLGERCSGGFEEIRDVLVDLLPGVESDQVRDVAVLVRWVVNVVDPLLDLAKFSDLGWVEVVHLVLKLVTEIEVLAQIQDIDGLDDIL